MKDTIEMVAYIATPLAYLVIIFMLWKTSQMLKEKRRLWKELKEQMEENAKFWKEYSENK